MSEIRTTKIDGVEFVTLTDYLMLKEEKEKMQEEIKNHKQNIMQDELEIIPKLEEENKKLKEEKGKLEKGNMMLETALIAMKHNKKPKYSIIYWKEKYQILDSTDDRVTSLLKDFSTKEYYCFDTLEEAEKCMDRIMFAEQVVVKEYY